MKERLAEVWRPVKGVTIKEAEPDLFLFQFYHNLGLQRIYDGGPWSFDDYLLILGRVAVGYILGQIPLFRVSFWVQIHDFPVGFYDSSYRSAPWKLYRRILGV